MYSRLGTIAATGTAATLPLTASEVLPFIAAAIGLMFAGVMLLRVARRNAG